MSAALRRLLLLALTTDALHTSMHSLLQTRCLHCRTTLQLSLDGAPVGVVTLEHIVPQNWFAKPSVIRALGVPFDDANDPRNLALACARCNHDKGKGHDARPNDARARAVVMALWQRRMQRWIDPPAIAHR